MEIRELPVTASPDGSSLPLTIEQRPAFQDELRTLLNRYSKENGSNTPDYMLAEFLTDCLAAYDKALTARDKWFGIDPWKR